MTRRKVTLSIDEFYHLYSRGVDKRDIFQEEGDYKRFMRLLYLCNGSIPVDFRKYKSYALGEIDTGEKLVSIGAYCLMPNHFHVVVREINENGIVKFMSKLLTAYSSYFNKKYERTGALFGSEFKSEHLDTDEYLKYIYSYVHLNPAKVIDNNWRESLGEKTNINKFLNTYKYSSYLDYLKKRENDQGLILNINDFPQYFLNPEDHQKEIWHWLKYNEESLPRGGLGKENNTHLENFKRSI